MTELRWGLLSTARINAYVLPELGDRALAVASRDADRARAYAQEHGIERAYGSYQELLADDDVDAVYVSLPNHLHVEWTMRALDAGKHVLTEKPFSRHPAEVERGFDLAEQRGLVVTEAFVWRHHPQVAKAQELIADGRIGELRSIVATHTATMADLADHRFDPASDGGALMDVGCYAVSGIRTFAGEPLSVTAQVATFNGVDARMVATLRMPGDVLATMDCALDSARRRSLQLVGSTGALTLTDPWSGHDHPRIQIMNAARDIEVIDMERPGSTFALEIADFERAVAGDATPLLGRADVVGQARAIEALYEAAGPLRA